MSSRGGGRDRFRTRFEDKTHGAGGGRANAPPSRHLWVGNLSHDIDESDLTDQFLRFGELESVAFQPGRSYAFVNFKSDEDAIASMKALQDFPLAGNPLRIEFAKADKSSVPSRDEQRSTLRGSPFSQRDSRARHASPPDSAYPDKSKMNDRSAEPSEVLWIGFPALLKVDEVILRKAFSPFGELEKITVFPGRSYAFVRFKNIVSACRAKETLQGKLFGNPRVHICFAKSEAGSSSSGKGSMNVPLSPRFKFNGHSSPADNFRPDRNFGSFSGDPGIRSPHLNPNLDSGDDNVYNFNRKDTLWSGGNNTYEPWRFGEVGSESQDIYEHSISPTRERTARFHDFPQKFSQKAPLYEDQWDSPEDAYYHPGAKKLKTGSLPPDKELPEYPFSDLEHGKRAFSRTFSDFAQPETFEKNFDSVPFGYKHLPDHQRNLTLSHREKSDMWKAPYDGYQVGPGSLPINPADKKRFTPELDQPKPSIKDWKWEGTIAKGGSPVCHARCFPVGKVMDMMLPEFLDCTARTGLDMLAKHYYQASCSWVVFFVPGSDADIAFYNEFMHYLEEKQRAAVAKLDDKTTLFLVPPSDFSEKVLKVPGKLSISGVVLRLEPSASNQGFVHYPNEIKDTFSDPSYSKPSIPSGSFPVLSSYPDMGKSGLSLSGDISTSALPLSYSSSVHAVGSMSELYSENRHEYPPHLQNPALAPNRSPHHLQNPVSGSRNIQSLASGSSVDPIIQGQPSVMQKVVQETNSSQYSSQITGIPLSENSKMLHQESKPSTLPTPITSLQPEQLAQLASTLLGPQRQVGNTANASNGENLKQMTGVPQFDNQFGQPQSYALQNNQLTEFSTSQFGQVQQLQQQLSNAPAAMPLTIEREVQSGGPGNQQLQSAGSQEADADPQKRLQATLHLAAALLQQIQRGKGT